MLAPPIPGPLDLKPAVAAETLATHVEGWLTRLESLGTPRTPMTYGAQLRLHVLPELGARLLTAIAPVDVIRVLDALASRRRPNGRPYAAATVRLTYAALHAAFADAVQARKLLANPAENLSDRYPRVIREAPYYTHADALAFLKEAILFSADWAFFFAVMFGAGLRVGETRALQRRDIDLVRKTIAVVRSADRYTGVVNEWTKGKRRRLVPFMESLLTPLTELLDARQGRWLFPETKGPDGYKRIWDAFREIAARAELDVHSPKAFRHSFGSVLAVVGVDLRTIQKAMGHADLRTTMIYADHIAPQRPPQLDEL